MTTPATPVDLAFLDELDSLLSRYARTTVSPGVVVASLVNSAASIAVASGIDSGEVIQAVNFSLDQAFESLAELRERAAAGEHVFPGRPNADGNRRV